MPSLADTLSFHHRKLKLTPRESNGFLQLGVAYSYGCVSCISKVISRSAPQVGPYITAFNVIDSVNVAGY